MQVEAAYYDGRSARRHSVRLSIEAGWLELHGDMDRREALAAVSISAPLGNTPRVVQFDDGARCEIADASGFSALLQAAGVHAPLLPRLEAQWRYALAALLLTAALAAAGYLWGLPVLAQAVAERVPQPALAVMDQQFLVAFDRRLLHASKLPIQRQQALRDKFLALRSPLASLRPSQVLFRSGPIIGPNAFALPGGSVVVLDELVQLAGDDEEILAVLAHEMGHVSERHAVRQMLQASVVGLALAWYVGDVSSLLAAAPTALLETRYSRDFERRADDFAARMLRLNRIPPARLGDILAKMEKALGAGSIAEPDSLNYLSTHPATAERIRRLKGEQ